MVVILSILLKLEGEPLSVSVEHLRVCALKLYYTVLCFCFACLECFIRTLKSRSKQVLGQMFMFLSMLDL